MSSRKKRQPLPAFRRDRDPASVNPLGGPIIDLIAMFDDLPRSKCTDHLMKLAQRYVAGEGVYSILTHEGSGSSQHTCMSVALAMCRLASPAVLSQWNAIALNEVIQSSSVTSAKPALSLISETLASGRAELALEMLEQVSAWYAIQPRPDNGRVLLHTAQGLTCMGNLLAQLPDDQSLRQRLLDVFQLHAKDPNGYVAWRLDDLMKTLAAPDKHHYDSFVDSAFRNAMSPEFSPHLNPCHLLWAGLNRCSPEALAHALISPLARDSLTENIETVVTAVSEFVYADGVNAAPNDDLERFERVIAVLLDHAPVGFPAQLLHAAQTAGPSLPDGGRDHLIGLIDRAILNHKVVDDQPEPLPGPRF